MSQINQKRVISTEQAARLNANHLELNLVVDKVRQYMASDASFKTKQDGLYFRGPRFGVFSLLLRRTPIYVYDHPAIKKLATTAFTDGTHIFFDADFLNELLTEERRAREENRRDHNLIPVVLHELAHILLHHVQDGKGQRLRNYPSGIANMACDIEINQRLLEDFRDTLSFGSWFMESALGVREDEILTFKGQSAETIARRLLQHQKQRNQNGNQSRSPESPGTSAGSGQSSKTDANTQDNKEQGQKPIRSTEQVLDDLIDQIEAGTGMETHTVSAQELEKTLRDNGLGHVADALAMPKDDAGRAKQQKKRQLELIEDLKQASRLQEQAEQAGVKLPGQHINEYASLIIKDLLTPKLQWKAHIEDVIVGDGAQTELLEEEPYDLYYVDPDDMGMNGEVYLPSPVSARPDDVVVVVMDTSGSVGVEELRAYFSEIFGIWRDHADKVGDVLVFSADTVVRGQPLRITEDNWREVLKSVPVFGRGGTDLETSMHQSLQAARQMAEGKSIRHLLYFTDLGDYPPKRERLPEDLPPVTFLTLPGDYTAGKHFEHAVSSFAQVIPIATGSVVDLGHRPSGPVLSPRLG